MLTWVFYITQSDILDSGEKKIILSTLRIHTVFHPNISNMADLRMKQMFDILVLDLQYGGFLLLFICSCKEMYLGR